MKASFERATIGNGKIPGIGERQSPPEVPNLPRRQEPPDALLTAEQVAERLNVTKDWVWDHSSRKLPRLPVIRLSDGVLRYRASQIEEFINERERLSGLRMKRR